MHWTDMTASNAAGRTGRLASPETDPFSGQPGFKDTIAAIEAIHPVWRGFLVSLQERDLSPCDYWVRSRLEKGWLYEIAGLSDIGIHQLLPEGKRSEVLYPSKGMERYAVQDKSGALIAALFLTRKGELPPRNWLAEQLGEQTDDPMALLAGRPRVVPLDRGPVVCVCHNVGAHEISATIEAGACSVEAIGSACRAGTNCGSCRPELSRILEEWEAEIKEAAE
ncbi:MAG: (2Fe-2S)-binding protein, partial [Pseudomonadota bacterium]